MTPADEIPCACEGDDPPNSPGLVLGDETLLYVVKNDGGVNWDGEIAKLSPAAIRNEDIEAKQEGKSVSCMRDKHMLRDQILARASYIARNDMWKDDPVVASVIVEKLREIRGITSWREVCVCADPTDAEDPAGACPEHASVKRSAVDPASRVKPPQGPMDKNKRRSAIAEAFGSVFHIKTGKPPQRA